MLLELDVQSIQRLLSDPDRLKLAIQTARTEYTKSHTPSVSPDPAQTTPGIDPAEISGDDIALWLYDRVNDLYPHNAAKITGGLRLLELGNVLWVTMPSLWSVWGGTDIQTFVLRPPWL